jgi:hypothetical protein
MTSCWNSDDALEPTKEETPDRQPVAAYNITDGVPTKHACACLRIDCLGMKENLLPLPLP